MRNLVKYLFLTFIVIFCLLYTPLLSDQRGMKIVAKDPETGEELNLYDDSWAIVIGINKYEFVTHLDYAVSDAKSIKKLLIEKFGFSEDHIEFLTDEKATVQGIKQAFQNITKKSKENNRVIVFYAGHGETKTLPTGGEMGFLIPVDGKIGELYLTCLPMQEIKTLSQMLPAKHVLFLVDACYGGLAAVSRRSLDRVTKGFLKKITKARARQILTAGSKDEQVIEKPEWGHSAFTYKLLDGLERELADLDDDGFITASELGIYIKSSVSKISDNYQTPQLKSLSGDEGEFVFLLKKDIIISETQIPEFQPKTFEGFGGEKIQSGGWGGDHWGRYPRHRRHQQKPGAKCQNWKIQRRSIFQAERLPHLDSTIKGKKRGYSPSGGVLFEKISIPEKKTSCGYYGSTDKLPLARECKGIEKHPGTSHDLIRRKKHRSLSRGNKTRSAGRRNSHSRATSDKSHFTSFRPEPRGDGKKYDHRSSKEGER